MNYKQIYDTICARGLTERHLDYYEKHHIIPKCLNGPDTNENLTKLTAREHYIAHWLLCKIYPKSWKIAHAFFWMATSNGATKRTITSVQYARAKDAMSKSCSLRSKEYNPMWTKSAKEKQSIRMRGDNNPSRKYPERHYLKNGGIGPSNECKWFNNGKDNKYFRSGDVIPDGWTQGMAPYADRGKWITNGQEITKLKDGQEMPEGFYYGKRLLK